MSSRRRGVSPFTLLGFGCGGLLLIGLVVIVVNLSLGAFCAEYVIESWAPYVVHHPVDVPWWPHAMLLGLFGGELTIPAALITWVLMSLL